MEWIWILNQKKLNILIDIKSEMNDLNDIIYKYMTFKRDWDIEILDFSKSITPLSYNSFYVSYKVHKFHHIFL